MGNCNNCDCNEADRLKEFDDNVTILALKIMIENWANIWNGSWTIQEERIVEILN